MISVLTEKYLMEHEDAKTLSAFLVPMMHFYPDARATAAELVRHPWLKGVVVQGEVEMHHAEKERLRALAEATREGKGKEREGGVGVEQVTGLGPPVMGMVGMGRI